MVSLLGILVSRQNNLKEERSNKKGILPHVCHLLISSLTEKEI